MSRGRRRHRLPSAPEGEDRDEAVDRLRKKLATVHDTERLLVDYHNRVVVPLQESVQFLLLPWYTRLWHRLGLVDRWRVLSHRVSRMWYARKWSRSEKGEG